MQTSNGQFLLFAAGVWAFIFSTRAVADIFRSAYGAYACRDRQGMWSRVALGMVAMAAGTLILWLILDVAKG